MLSVTSPVRKGRKVNPYPNNEFLPWKSVPQAFDNYLKKNTSTIILGHPLIDKHDKFNATG